MKDKKQLDSVSFATFKKLYLKLAAEQERYDTEFEISFEFLVASLFPQVWKNINQALADEHTKGYIEGKKSNEGKRINRRRHM